MLLSQYAERGLMTFQNEDIELSAACLEGLNDHAASQTEDDIEAHPQDFLDGQFAIITTHHSIVLVPDYKGQTILTCALALWRALTN